MTATKAHSMMRHFQGNSLHHIELNSLQTIALMPCNLPACLGMQLRRCLWDHAGCMYVLVVSSPPVLELVLGKLITNAFAELWTRVAEGILQLNSKGEPACSSGVDDMSQHADDEGDVHCPTHLFDSAWASTGASPCCCKCQRLVLVNNVLEPVLRPRMVRPKIELMLVQ